MKTTFNLQEREYTCSENLANHFAEKTNYTNIVIAQINNGLYDRFVKGKKDLTIIDAGANVGLVSLFFLPYCKKLICIEPTPSHYNLLTELLSDKPKPKQHLFFSNRALAPDNSEYNFIVNQSTENKIVEFTNSTTITVTGQTLSDIVGENYVDLFKVDIEGGEYAALVSDEILKVRNRVKNFFIEIHPYQNIGIDENRNTIAYRFRVAGYTVEEIDYQTIIASR